MKNANAKELTSLCNLKLMQFLRNCDLHQYSVRINSLGLVFMYLNCLPFTINHQSRKLQSYASSLQGTQTSFDTGGGYNVHFTYPFVPLPPWHFDVQNIPLALQLHLLPGAPQSLLHLHFPVIPTTLYNDSAVCWEMGFSQKRSLSSSIDNNTPLSTRAYSAIPDAGTYG